MPDEYEDRNPFTPYTKEWLDRVKELQEVAKRVREERAKAKRIAKAQRRARVANNRRKARRK